MRIFCVLRNISGKAAEKFCKYGAFSPTPVSLNKLTIFGQNACQQESFKFLRHEIPVRLANIMQEIHLLPEKLLEMPSVKLVISWYEQSFIDIVPFENLASDDKTLGDFTEVMDVIRKRHTDVVHTMAEGIMELKERYGSDLMTDSQLQYFLDRFYLSRISIRMLINQHVLLFGPTLGTAHLKQLGAIDPSTNVISVLEDAYHDARFLCEQYYLDAPELRIDVVLHGEQVDNTKFLDVVYVPSHLHHMCFELLKNAMRATMEKHESSNKDTPAYIRALICAGDEDLTIKISDRGGGIPRSLIESVYKYTYTTASSQLSSGTGGSAPLAGYGYGLPLSRLYAQYFNGDLTLSSVEGFGTDAYIFLKRHAADADELLPVFNQTSARQYQHAVPVGDWSNRARTTGLHTHHRNVTS